MSRSVIPNRSRKSIMPGSSTAVRSIPVTAPGSFLIACNRNRQNLASFPVPNTHLMVPVVLLLRHYSSITANGKNFYAFNRLFAYCILLERPSNYKNTLKNSPGTPNE